MLQIGYIIHLEEEQFSQLYVLERVLSIPLMSHDCLRKRYRMGEVALQ